MNVNEEREPKISEQTIPVVLDNNVSSCRVHSASKPHISQNSLFCLEHVFELNYEVGKIEEFPCWMICDALLKGRLFLTSRHLCFYATLPVQSIEKSGYLKRYYRNNKKPIVTCQSTLKDGVLLFYYSNSAIFLTGGIQMKEVLTIVPSKKRKCGFKIHLQHKTFRFVADSDFSRDAWMKVLKASKFAASQESDEVLIKLPLENICTIDLTTNAAKSETIKLKAFDDNPNIFEEYYFTYFSNASGTFDSIKYAISKRKQEVYSSRKDTNFVADTIPNQFHLAFEPLSGSPNKRFSKKMFSFSSASDSEDSVFDLPMIKHHEWGLSEKEQASPKDHLYDIRSEFAISKKDVLIKYFDAYMFKIVPRIGRIYVFEDVVLFKSNLIGIKTKILLKTENILYITSEQVSSLIPYRISLTTKDSSQVYFDFFNYKESVSFSTLLQSRMKKKAIKPVLERRLSMHTHGHVKSSFAITELNKLPLPLSIDGPTRITQSPMHITCLTIGTRGDVQPYIALCKGLMRDGHTCRIGTHLEYKDWIESHGIEYKEVKGDPAALMQLCVENGMFTYSFIKEAKGKFKTWIDELLDSCWDACQGTEMIIEAPTAMAGVHIAETLNISYFGSFTMPWTRTKYYPHPFAVSERHLGAGYNYMSHLLMEQIFWMGVAPQVQLNLKVFLFQVNKWRKTVLGRSPVQLGSLNDHKIPFLYSFSPSVVPNPPDWQDWIHTCGYWFLDNPDVSWTPSEALTAFLEIGDKPIYIGFGSIVVSDPEEMTDIIVEAVQKAGVRAILSKGWSDRSGDSREEKTSKKDRVYPECIFAIDKVPHDWLFPQVAGVVHHGGMCRKDYILSVIGAGTTAAGLRAGIPCIIRPFFGDQYFWADRVQELGVGYSIKKFHVGKLTKLFKELTSNMKLHEKAKQIGLTIRAENGVENAIQCIYRDIEFSKEKIKELSDLSYDVTVPQGSKECSSPLKKMWNLMFSDGPIDEKF